MSELISRCLDGDKAARDSLYSAYAGRINTYFLRSALLHADADELTLEVFAQILESLQTFDASRGSFLGWLASIARATAKGAHSRQTNPQDFDPVLAEELFASEDRAVAPEELDALSRCIDTLPPELARVVHLRYVQGRSLRGIASLLTDAETEVQDRLQRAAGMLRQSMEAKGYLKAAPEGSSAPSEEPPGSEDQLERLRRRWGVEEALRQARPPLRVSASRRGPAARPRRERPPRPSKWPVAAGLVLLALAVALVAADRLGLKLPFLSDRPAAVEDESPRLRADLARVTSELQEARARAEEAQSRAGEAEKEIAKLRDTLDKTSEQLGLARAALSAEQQKFAGEKLSLVERAKLLESEAAELPEAQRKLTEKLEDLAKATETLAKAEAEAARLKSELAEARAAAEATAEGMGRRTEENLARLGAAEAKLAALEAERTARAGLLQALYIEAAAPGESGLRAHQIAQKKARLLPRLALLRETVTSPETLRICDAVEVLLTRLDLLDANSEPQVSAFLELARRTSPRSQIEKLLSAGGDGPAVRAWLTESLLILPGE